MIGLRINLVTFLVLLLLLCWLLLAIIGLCWRLGVYIVLGHVSLLVRNCKILSVVGNLLLLLTWNLTGSVLLALRVLSHYVVLDHVLN